MTAPAKSSDASVTEMNQIVLPPHTNARGTAFGGTVMAWVDICAAMAAQRHARSAVVTARMEAVDFIVPIRLGNLVNLRATVDYVGRTSMVVAVRVEAEEPSTGARAHAVNAYVTFVALDESGEPIEVPRLELTTEEARERHGVAAAIRASRKG